MIITSSCVTYVKIFVDRPSYQKLFWLKLRILHPQYRNFSNTEKTCCEKNFEQIRSIESLKRFWREICVSSDRSELFKNVKTPKHKISVVFKVLLQVLNRDHFQEWRKPCLWFLMTFGEWAFFPNLKKFLIFLSRWRRKKMKRRTETNIFQGELPAIKWKEVSIAIFIFWLISCLKLKFNFSQKHKRHMHATGKIVETMNFWIGPIFRTAHETFWNTSENGACCETFLVELEEVSSAWKMFWRHDKKSKSVHSSGLV